MGLFALLCLRESTAWRTREECSPLTRTKIKGALREVGMLMRVKAEFLNQEI